MPLQKKEEDGGGNDDDKTDEEVVNAFTDENDMEFMNTDAIPAEEVLAMIEEEEAILREEEEAKFLPNWKPGLRKRPIEVSYRLEDFDEDDSYVPWTLRDKRCGALAIKVGMLPVWDGWGERHACTVLFLDSNIIVSHKTVEKHGYRAVQVAAGERKKKKVKKVVMGQYEHLPELAEQPPYIMREFRVTEDACLPEVGSRLHARHFVPGQNVDVSGITKGKGFQGGIKRHGFGGMPATHGTSKSHRAIGSTGQCQDPGKVFKGKKMPGQMGGDRVTKQNLRIVKIDRGRNLLFVKGAVPGNKGGFVEIRDAVKKPLWGTEMVVGELDRPPIPTFEYDETKDGTGELGMEEFMPMQEVDPLHVDAVSIAQTVHAAKVNATRE